jgi:hypothetical protein
VDLAKKYSNELVKVIPKPKNFVPVKPVVVNILTPLLLNKS